MVFSAVTWNYKDTVTSAKLAAMVENIKVHDHRADGSQGAPTPYVAVARSSALALANGVGVDVTFPTEEADPFGFHDTAVNTDRLTVPAGMGGIYVATFWGNTAPGAATMRLIATIYRNSTSMNNHYVSVVAGDGGDVTVSSILSLAAGDIVRGRMTQIGNASVNLNNARLGLALVART